MPRTLQVKRVITRPLVHATTVYQATQIYNFFRRGTEPEFIALTAEDQNRWRVFAFDVEQFFMDPANHEDEEGWQQLADIR